MKLALGLVAFLLACILAGYLGGAFAEWRFWRTTPPLPPPPAGRGDPYLLAGWREVEQLAPSSKDDRV